MIRGTPEGRPGIWLITPEAACDFVDGLKPTEIHNFIGHGVVMIGANWPKQDVRELLCSPGKRIALVFAPQWHGKHQLVVLNDEKRWAFDVGEISESSMVEE